MFEEGTELKTATWEINPPFIEQLYRCSECSHLTNIRLSPCSECGRIMVYTKDKKIYEYNRKFVEDKK